MPKNNKIEQICIERGKRDYFYPSQLSRRKNGICKECLEKKYKKEKRKKVCKRCGKEEMFTSYRFNRANKDYCTKCYKEVRKEKNIWKNCLECGILFPTTKYLVSIGKGIYCCKDCMNKSEVYRKKLSESQSGSNNYWYGKFGEEHHSFGNHPTEETLEKLRLSHTGKVRTAESIERGAAKMRGRKRPPFSDEWRENIRLSGIGLHSGEKNPGWIDGRTPFVKLIRHLSCYKYWEKMVKKRDDFTCQKCNIRGGKLHSHHKKSFNLIYEENKDKINFAEDAYNIPEFWDLDNGITLCKKCHDNFHGIYGHGNNIVEQTEEFLK
jgi:hypothetical protein